MAEFKGTRGKWKLANNEYGYYTSVRNIDDTRKICVSRVNNMLESNANMLLISKATEMLEMLKMWCMDMEERGKAYGDCYTMTKQLIKEATEL